MLQFYWFVHPSLFHLSPDLFTSFLWCSMKPTLPQAKPEGRSMQRSMGYRALLNLMSECSVWWRWLSFKLVINHCHENLHAYSVWMFFLIFGPTAFTLKELQLLKHRLENQFVPFVGYSSLKQPTQSVILLSLWRQTEMNSLSLLLSWRRVLAVRSIYLHQKPHSWIVQLK